VPGRPAAATSALGAPRAINTDLRITLGQVRTRQQVYQPPLNPINPTAAKINTG